MSWKTKCPKTVTERSPAPESLLPQSLILLLVAGLALVCYLNADHEEWLFDSDHIELFDPSQDFSLHVQRLFWPFWKPGQSLSIITFVLNGVLNETLGLDTYDITTFLFINVLIHALNACLVYFLVGAMLRQIEPDQPKSMWIPLALAVLFAIHPLHASSIAYVVQRRGMMATTFYILAILCYLRVRRDPSVGMSSTSGAIQKGKAQAQLTTSARPWSRMAMLVGVLVCYWLSFKSKPLGITLPFAILAVEFCLRASNRQALKRYLAVMFPGLILTVVVMFVFAYSRGLFDIGRMQILPWGPNPKWGPWVHFLTESRVFVHYWKLLILPLPCWSCGNHDFELSKSLFDHYSIVAILFHGSLLLSAVFAALRRYPLAALGVFWFYIALIPYIVLPQTELLVEYKTYLPSIGLVLILAEGLRVLRERVPMKVQVLLVTVLAVLLMSTTIRRNAIYQSPYNFWTDALEKGSNHFLTHDNLACVMLDRGEVDKAIFHFQEALRLMPEYSNAHLNLANTLVKQKRYDEAVDHFEKSIYFKPKFAQAYNDYGVALTEMGKKDEAFKCYSKAVELEPDSLEALSNLASEYLERGNANEAIKHYHKVLEINPDYPEALNNLAAAMVKLGQVKEAVGYYQQAIRIKKNYPNAHYNLANALIRLGKVDQAIEHYEEALRLEPNYPYIHFKLAQALRGKGRIDEAIKRYSQALELMPDNPDFHNDIALVLVRKDQAAKAIEHYNRALQIRPHYAEAHNNLALLFIRLQRTDEAVTHFQQAVKYKPDFFEAHNNLGGTYARIRRFDKALEHLQTAVRINPHYADAHANLGNVLFEKGRIDEAVRHYRLALSINPQHPHAQKGLNSALAEQQGAREK
ncbi:MAG: tetratricopeptide repeat protein [Planctomycetota bacterium]|nr:MAG: tetratricopeptide repeat protein [Planctomycetota bacterium]